VSLADTLAAGRAAAEARMPSVAKVHRKTGSASQNESTGLVSPTWTDVITSTPFRLSGAVRGSASYRTQDLGADVEVASRIGHFPAATTGLQDGDYVEITSGENAGLVFRIIEATWQDQATAVRVPVEAVVRPTEWGA
jgi:hypothetical protein